MDFEKIEQAYTYLLENVQVIQSDLATNFYDALVEQNSIYLDGETAVSYTHLTLPTICSV